MYISLPVSILSRYRRMDCILHLDHILNLAILSHVIFLPPPSPVSCDLLNDTSCAWWLYILSWEAKSNYILVWHISAWTYPPQLTSVLMSIHASTQMYYNTPNFQASNWRRDLWLLWTSSWAAKYLRELIKALRVSECSAASIVSVSCQKW